MLTFLGQSFQVICPSRHDFDLDELLHGPNPEPMRIENVSGFAKQAKHSLRELGDKQVGRAMRALGSHGTADLSHAAALAKLLSKYPKYTGPQLQRHHANADLVPELSAEGIQRVIELKASATAPGRDRWNFHDLKFMVAESLKPGAHPAVAAFTGNLAKVCTLICKGTFDSDRVRPAITTLLGHALCKTDVLDPGLPGFDIRPVGIASAIYVTAVSALRLTNEYKDTVRPLCSNLDFATFKAGGVEAIVHAVRGRLAACPSAIAVDLDLDNAFGAVLRQSALDLALKVPMLAPLLNMLFARPTRVIYEHKGTDYEVMAECGLAQGDPLSMELFVMVLSNALAPVDAGLQLAGAMLPRFADNMTVVANAGPAFDIVDKIEAALVPTGLKIKRPKCKVLLRNSVPAADSLTAMNKAAELGFKVVNHLKLCGSPIGAPDECKEIADEIVDDACDKLKKLVNLATFQSSLGALSKQSSLTLMRFCVAPATIVHLLRTTPPDIVIDACQRFDNCVEESVLAIIESLHLVEDNDKRGRLNQRLHLDAVAGGCGIASAAALADAAYAGSLALTLHFAAGLLPAGADLNAAFPHLKQLLDEGIFKEVDGLKELTVEVMAEGPIEKAQRRVTLHRRAGRLQKALDATTSAQAKADLRSQASAEASAWLTVVPGNNKALRIENGVVPTVWRKWLGLDTSRELFVGLPGDHNARRCLACSPLPPPGANPNPQLAGANAQPPVSITNEKTVGCSHALSCRGGGRNGVAGMIKGGRHNNVNNAIEYSLRSNARRPDGSAVTIVHEPSLFDVAMAKTADPKKQRGDTLVRLVDGSSVVIDTTIALVNVATHPSAADKAGVVAEKRVAHKNAKYNAAWDLHGNVTLVIAAIETGGRWSPGFMDYLKTYIKAAHPDDTKAFVFQLKAAAQRVSVALQRSTALAILEMNRRAKTYPSLKV